MAEEITALVPSTFEECEKIAKRLAPSKLLAAHLRNDEASVYLTLLAGRELGIPPMAALRAFHFIDGVPRLSADAMRAIVSASPLCEYLRPVEQTAESCTWETKRRGHPPVRYTFTMTQAQRAGVIKDSGGWKKYPERMLSARASSFLARDVYPELLAGLLSSEEAEDLTGLTPVDKAGAIEAFAATATATAASVTAPAAQEPKPALSLTEAEEGAISALMGALPDAETPEELDRLHSALIKESAPVFDAVAPHLYRTMIRASTSKEDLAWVAGRIKDRPGLKELLRDDYTARSKELASAPGKGKP